MTNAIKKSATPNATPSGILAPIVSLKLHHKFYMWSSKIICKRTHVSKKTELCPLALQVFLPGRIKKHLHLGIFVNPNNWLDKEQCVKVFSEADHEINLLIASFKAAENQILFEYKMRRQPLTWDAFLNRIKMGDSIYNFISYFEQKIEEKEIKGELEHSTAKTHRSVLRKCKDFKSIWTFSDIDDKFISDFKEFMQNRLKSNSKKNGKKLISNGQNTINMALKITKTYLLNAKKDKIQFDMPNIKIKWTPTSRTFLTQAETMKFIKMYKEEFFKEPGIKKQALEMFVFACTTGLRISDIKKIKSSDINDGFIVLKPKKTEKEGITVKIPLTPLSQVILEGKNGKIFEKYSEQKINEALKDIAKILGIEKKISMNVGRHTFATLFIQNSGNLKALQDLLGHKNIITTQNYLHVDHGYLKEEMKSLNNLFN